MNTVRDRLEILDSVLMHGAVCAEIGVLEGDFSQEILARTDPKRLHLIDIWAHNGPRGSVRGDDKTHAERMRKVSLRFSALIKQGRVMLHQGYSADVVPLFPDDYFDWIYVDGGHHYDIVYRDLECCHRAVKPGGVIACHDYSLPEQKATIQNRGGSYLPGVAQAVREFCDKYGWEVFCVSEVGALAGPDPCGSLCPTCVLRQK